jgi:type I restriction enzyme S subunit
VDLSEKQFVGPPTGTEGERTRVRQGDLLVSITAYLGSVAVVREDLGPTYVNQHLALVRLDQAKLLPAYAAYALISRDRQDQFRAFAAGGTKEGMSLDDVRNLRIPVAPLLAQAATVEHLDRQAAKTQELIQALTRQISLLREYRQALITAAVTGQIDVTSLKPEALCP